MKPTINHTVSDKELISRTLKGDKQAFALIVKQTERLVAQIVYKMIAEQEDRKDLAQETYLKAFRNLANFKGNAKLSTWIAQICYNACIDHLRKKQQQVLQLMTEEGEQLAEAAIAEPLHIAVPEDELQRKQLADTLQQMLQQIPAEYQLMITLYHQEELSYTEIEHITGMPMGTVKSYLFRARKMLKDKLLMQYKKEELW